MNKVEQIKAEIKSSISRYEKILSKVNEEGNEDNVLLLNSKIDCLKGVISLINSLDNSDNSDHSENPASKDLEQASREYIANDDNINDSYRDAFKAGANWQREQMMKQAKEGEFPYINPADELGKEIENIWGKLSVGGIFTATKSGFAEVVSHFTQWQRNQLVKQTVDGKVSHVLCHIWGDLVKYSVEYPTGKSPFSKGNKVKLIIIKEED